MKTLGLGWAMVKEDAGGVYFMTPADATQRDFVPSQSVYVPNNNLRELGRWLTDLAEAKKV